MNILPHRSRIVAADGLPLEVVGIAENVFIELERETYYVNFTIVKNLSTGCIIGFDLLRKEKAKISKNVVK